MTNGNDSAYPEIYTDLDKNNPQASGDTYSTGGLTKREYFAAMAMQGFIAAHSQDNYVECFRDGVLGGQKVGRCAVMFADALIDALNKEATNEA